MKMNDDKFKVSMLISNMICVIMLILQIIMLHSINYNLYYRYNNSSKDNTIANVKINKSSKNSTDAKMTSMNLLKNSTEYEVINFTKEISKDKKIAKSKSAEEVNEFTKYKELYEPMEVSIKEETIPTMAKAVIADDNEKANRYTNLYNKNEITTQQMNTIINNWLNGRSSELQGTGQAFIDASNKTGYDPIFLLALAANESGWTVSNLHASKCNPYSIAMIDSNPSGGYTLGSTYYEGIVNGAIWINDNFYEKGNKNLHDMIYKGNYSSSKDKWINDILWIMNKSYQMIY